MTILGALARRSLENPNVPLTSASLIEWMGGTRTKAGVAAGEQRVYGLSAYLRAMGLMGGTMACLPLKVYQRGSRTRVTQKTVLDSPNPRQTPFEFWQTMVVNACGYGNAYARKVRNNADVVQEVWSIHPSKVSVKATKPTDVRPDGLEFTVQGDDGMPEKLSSWEIFRIPFLAPNGVEGLSPLRAARESLGIGIAAEDHAAKFYGNGTKLSGLLQVKDSIDDPRANRLRARWKELHTGVENAWDIGVLDNGAEFKELSLSPVDAQLLESRKFTVVEIARMFGIPPHLLGDVERSTSWGTGIEQQAIGFVTYTLQPWLTAIEQRVTRELLPGGWSSGRWYSEYALGGLLRGDSAARAAFYAQMIQWGVFNRNEVRVLENLEPVDGLDEFLTPSNMTLITVDGKLQPLSAAGDDATAPNNAE